MTNVLFITLDQFRGDTLSCAGHPLVRTPALDDLAANGVRFARHYSQSAPCSPGRASLYTGMYQMNHRVVANGTPLSNDFDNIARVARRAGYSPVLFGYTDQSIDPRVTIGPNDERLNSYQGVLPGFESLLDLTHEHDAWIKWLNDNGFDVPVDHIAALQSEPDRPAEFSLSAFLTNSLLEWISQQDTPWFAHASYLRPHSPYAAAGHFSTMYDPADVPLPIPCADSRHPLHDVFLTLPISAAPTDEQGVRAMRAQYYGMVSEVDSQLARVWDALRRTGAWDDTVVIVTADHGEMLGDHGLKEKLGYWESSYHIVSIIRDPLRPSAHGKTVECFTENVDIVPTVCELLGEPVPLQCDGAPLTPFLDGTAPRTWREAASWEWDWRFSAIPHGDHSWPWNRRLEDMNLAVHRTESVAYVQFGDGSFLCFDIAADPTWRTMIDNPDVVLQSAQRMLTWRMRHASRNMTGLLVENGGVGRWPDGVPWRAHRVDS